MNEEARKILNEGGSVGSSFDASEPQHEGIVTIFGQRKSDTPHEEFRHLNSEHSMWEVFDYVFLRVEIDPRWRQYETDWDQFCSTLERRIATTDQEFHRICEEWDVDVDELSTSLSLCLV